MTVQVNVRLPKNLLEKAQAHTKKYGYRSLQELIRETIRETVYEEPVFSPEEIDIIRKIIGATHKHGVWSSEEELFKALRK